MRDAWTNYSIISPAKRLLLNPILPVAQKVQPILQPTYEDTHKFSLDLQA